MITPKQYVEKKGGECPCCGSGNLSGDSVTIETGKAFQPVGCNDCNASWCDTYVLTGYAEFEEGQT